MQLLSPLFFLAWKIPPIPTYFFFFFPPFHFPPSKPPSFLFPRTFLLFDFREHFTISFSGEDRATSITCISCSDLTLLTPLPRSHCLTSSTPDHPHHFPDKIYRILLFVSLTFPHLPCFGYFAFPFLPEESFQYFFFDITEVWYHSFIHIERKKRRYFIFYFDSHPPFL